MNDYSQYLICYDTPSNKRRRKLVVLLEEHCERVQMSVFEGWMTSHQHQQLQRRLQFAIDANEDNIRIYRLCHYCQSEVNLIGVSEATELVRYWIC